VKVSCQTLCYSFAQMRATFWGTRGSVPTPGPSTVRYGGNTACVEMRTQAGTFFIFDSGTGIRELGLQLTRQGGPVNAHLMLGHTHWDHISGFPFFTPVFNPGNRLAIYGARDLDRSLRDVLAGQMHYTYFPVPLGDLRADMSFCELEESTIQIEDATVRTHYLNHTAVCMGYRLEADAWRPTASRLPISPTTSPTASSKTAFDAATSMAATVA
jgi:phosphoribosyl 1,2-cyclic phosphodiesterase